MINIFFEDIEEFEININISNQVNKIIKEEGKTPGDITFVLCSDPYILKMNNDYLGHDYYTDVITFDYSENEMISGDIFIGIETVKDNAKNYEETFKSELFRVMIHGVLHLLGYNDKTDSEQEEMTNKENYYLDKLM